MSLEMDPGGNEAVYDGMPASEVAAMRAYFLTYMVLAVPFMLLALFVSVCSSVALYLHVKRKSRSIRVLYWIVGASSCAFLLQVVAWAHVVRDWAGMGAACSISPKFGTALYVSSNIFCYLFLLERAQAVSACTGSKYKYLRSDRLLTCLTYATYASPVLVIICFALVQGKAVTMPQLSDSAVCAYVIDVGVGVLLVVLDTSLSLGYLAAFVLPVREVMLNAADFNDNTGASIMMNMIRTNLRASLAAITTTFVLLVAITVGYSRPGGPTMLYWTWTYPLSTLDTTVNVLMMASITSVWMPKKVRKFVSRLGLRSGGSTNNVPSSARASGRLAPTGVGTELDIKDKRFRKLDGDSSMELRESFCKDSSHGAESGEDPETEEARPQGSRKPAKESRKRSMTDEL